MRIRTILRFLAALCGLTFSAVARQPNIVLIFTDDLGWRDVGWNTNGEFIETPHLDALRKESMTFTSAYAAAGNCAPSRACLLSGQYGPRHGVYAVGSTDRGPKKLCRLTPEPNKEELAASTVTMAEALHAQGYATGHFGKWHIGRPANGTGPEQQGFDISGEGLSDPAGEGGGTADPKTGKGKKKAGKNGGPEDPKHIFSITKQACDFITANREKPFFAYVAHHAVHTGHEARMETLAKFKAKAQGLTTPHVSALYAACIYDMDAGVGRLLAHLKAENLEQDTLVIFTSDNGGANASNNEPLRGAKGGYYEGGIREAFLVRWPGQVKPGSECHVPVINQDLYPTFVAAAGGTPAAALDGTSLLPLFTGGSTLERPAVFWHFPGYLDSPVPRGRDPVFRTRPVTVIRKGDWKLHLYHEEWLLDGGREKLAANKAVELYNVVKDIGEREDLAATETAKRDELLDDLLAWMKKTHAPFAKKP